VGDNAIYKLSIGDMYKEAVNGWLAAPRKNREKNEPSPRV